MRSWPFKPVAIAVAACVLSGSLSFAQSTINQREKRQQKRIADGVRSGELTGHEARKLEKEQRRIRRDEAKAKSDGQFTAKERAKIQKEQDHASRDIYKEKHDKQTQN